MSDWNGKTYLDDLTPDDLPHMQRQTLLTLSHEITQFLQSVRKGWLTEEQRNRTGDMLRAIDAELDRRVLAELTYTDLLMYLVARMVDEETVDKGFARALARELERLEQRL